MTNITAALGGVTSLATPVTVEAGTLESVAITPATAGVNVGASMQLNAYGNYEIPGATNPFPTALADITHEVTWLSSNSSIASVSSSGVVTGIAAGTVTISVNMAGFVGTPETAAVTVVPAPPNWTLTGNIFHQTATQTATLLNDGTVLLAGGEDSSRFGVRPRGNLYTQHRALHSDHRQHGCRSHTAHSDPSARRHGPDRWRRKRNGWRWRYRERGNLQSHDGYVHPHGQRYERCPEWWRHSDPAEYRQGTRRWRQSGWDKCRPLRSEYENFTPTGALNVGRAYATATLLTSGDVLIAGGKESSDTGGALTSASVRPCHGHVHAPDRYHGVRAGISHGNLIERRPSPHCRRDFIHRIPRRPACYEELYDPPTQTFLQTGALNAPRIAHNALLWVTAWFSSWAARHPMTLRGCLDRLSRRRQPASCMTRAPANLRSLPT